MKNYLAAVAVLTTLAGCAGATQTVPASEYLTDSGCVPVANRDAYIGPIGSGSCHTPNYNTIAESWRALSGRPPSGTATLPKKATSG